MEPSLGSDAIDHARGCQGAGTWGCGETCAMEATSRQYCEIIFFSEPSIPMSLSILLVLVELLVADFADLDCLGTV